MPLPGIEPGPLPYRGSARPPSCGGAACRTGRHRTDNLLGANQANPDLRLVVPVLDRSSSTRMCRPQEPNQDVPLFRRLPGPPRPGRRTPLRSVRGSNPSRWRDKPLASPEAQRTRHCKGDWRESNSRRATTLAGSQPADGPFVVSRHEAGEVGAEGIEPPSRGNRPRALPLDDAPVVSQGGRD